jgi:general secretion pathway protein K
METMKTDSRLRPNEGGFALILVLLVTGALSVLILDMNYRTRVNIHLAENLRDDIRAYFLARGAVEAAKALLLEDESFDYDDLDSEDDAIWATPNRHEENNGAIVVELVIQDEDGKLWINDTTNIFKKQLALGTGLPSLLLNLQDQLALEEEVFESIQDWIDTDDTPMPFGAENDYYQSLVPPYETGNNKLTDLSELFMVKGVNDAIYYGNAEEERPGLRDVFTVFGGAPSKINVNTARPEVLAALVDGSFAEEVEANRPITTEADIPSTSGGGNIRNRLGVKSTYFSAHIRVKAHNVVKRVHAVLKRDSNNDKVDLIYWRET